MDMAVLYSAEPEERPKIVYSLLSAVPESMLFNGSEKLTENGYRWADARLAKSHLDVYSPWSRVQKDPDGLVGSFCWYSAAIGWDELIKETLLFYDADLGIWLGLHKPLLADLYKRSL